MLLSLTVKVGEVGQGQYRRTAALWSAEERGLQPVIVPLWSKRPRDLCSFGSLWLLVGGAEPKRTTAGDLTQSQTYFKLQSRRLACGSPG